MSDETLGITTDNPMCFAVQLVEGVWLEIEGTMSSVDGFCHKIEFPGFVTRSGESFGITATFHDVEKQWQDGGKKRADIRRWVMVNGLLQTVETVHKAVFLISH